MLYLPFNPSYSLLAYIIMFYFCIQVDILYFHHMINILCIAMLCRKQFQIRRGRREKEQLRQTYNTPVFNLKSSILLPCNACFDQSLTELGKIQIFKLS